MTVSPVHLVIRRLSQRLPGPDDGADDATVVFDLRDRRAGESDDHPHDTAGVGGTVLRSALGDHVVRARPRRSDAHLACV